MKLHMVDVVGQYQKIKPDVDAAIHKILDSGQFILGKEVGEFECQIAGYLGVKYAVGCASGTDALQVAMMALDIGPGDEVITTPFTFVATTETIVLLGAKPVYVDIDPKTFNINPSQIESVITSKTKAIIPVHLYGQSADMDPIMEIARKHGLKVIEDSAQALGASYKGRKVCTFGDLSCISYFPSKNLGAFGDAGMVVTNDVALGEKVRMICAHGSKVRYYHEALGVNSRLDTLQAVILSVKLNHLDNWNAARRAAAETYNELLKETPVTIPFVAPDCEHIFHQYTLRAPKRNELADYLKQKGIPHAIYYPVPLHLQKAFAVAGKQSGAFPVTEYAADEVLSLPIHTELTEEQLVYITDAIKEFYRTR
ncbi:MAG: DegT/DnrJ/EryC1/StrS family aminotransferase [Bacteroidetes bacterium]|nr:DegT/DnrJ/EryC1/StrS family aminotransferase [Bacteroidota bacterium]MCW5895352.1 DegT/DnrJ/EryC1/StrS family aminotransferase [Bacteroidota bacterium]